VGLANQTGFSITAPGAKTYGDAGFTLTAAGGQSAGGVAFSVPAGNGVLTVTSGGAATIVGAGSVTVTVTKGADGSYNAATDTLTVTVAPRDIAGVVVTVNGTWSYTGNQLQPTFSVSDGLIAITTGDYTNSYGANMDAGTNAGSITLAGQGNYTGTKTVNFDIDKLSLAGAVVTLSGTSFTRTGSPITPTVTSLVIGGVTVPATEYDVSYSDNINAETAATVTVTAKAGSVNFTGSESVTFTITQSSGGGGGGGTSYTNASLSANRADFDKNGENDISVTLNKGSYALSRITNGTYTLKEGTD
jgi:hypothetical protein